MKRTLWVLDAYSIVNTSYLKTLNLKAEGFKHYTYLTLATLLLISHRMTTPLA